MPKNDTASPTDTEHFEVSYTDLAGDRRHQTTSQDADAKTEAIRLLEEGMAGIEITKVTTTRTSVPFEIPTTPEPEEAPAEPTQEPPPAPPKGSMTTTPRVEIT